MLENKIPFLYVLHIGSKNLLCVAHGSFNVCLSMVDQLGMILTEESGQQLQLSSLPPKNSCQEEAKEAVSFPCEQISGLMIKG